MRTRRWITRLLSVSVLSLLVLSCQESSRVIVWEVLLEGDVIDGVMIETPELFFKNLGDTENTSLVLRVAVSVNNERVMAALEVAGQAGIEDVSISAER